jgi:hypothetical protein
MTAVDASPKLLSALIGAIYDCALDPARWENALGEMVAALDCKNALLSLTDMRYDRLLLTRNFGMNEEWWRSFHDKHIPEVAAQLSTILASWPSAPRPYDHDRDPGFQYIFTLTPTWMTSNWAPALLRPCKLMVVPPELVSEPDTAD